VAQASVGFHASVLGACANTVLIEGQFSHPIVVFLLLLLGLGVVQHLHLDGIVIIRQRVVILLPLAAGAPTGSRFGLVEVTHRKVFDGILARDEGARVTGTEIDPALAQERGE
jgi:hypothetical protein